MVKRTSNPKFDGYMFYFNHTTRKHLHSNNRKSSRPLGQKVGISHILDTTLAQAEYTWQEKPRVATAV